MKSCFSNKEQLTIHHYSQSSELPEIWDEFLPDDHFLLRTNLKVTEDTHLSDLSFLYVLILVDDRAVFAGGFQILVFNKAHVNKEMVEPYKHLLWRTYLGLCKPKLLVSGHLFRHDISALYCEPFLDPYQSYRYYKQAIDFAFQQSKAAAVLVKDMPDKLAKYFQNYDPEYIMLRNDISMEMSIPTSWETIEDYETALKHKYAQRFRKVRQSWDELLTKELSTEEVSANKQKLFELYKQVTNNQQVRIGLLNEDFLPKLKEAYPDTIRVWGIYEGNDLIGFYSAWLRAEVFDMFYIGFDYEKNRALNLYFNILNFSIEQAIKFKKEKLILGRTALDAKARLGCKPKYLSTFVYVKNRFVRTGILSVQKNTSEQEGAWENRHPFKKQ